MQNSVIKYGLILVGVLVVFGLGYWFAYGTKLSENAELKKQLQAIEVQKTTIDKQQSELKEQIKVKEAEADVKEAEVSNLQAALAAKSKNLDNERQKVKKAVETYEQELANISIPTDNFIRCERLCRSRAELGYPCAATFCDQYK